MIQSDREGRNISLMASLPFPPWLLLSLSTLLKKLTFLIKLKHLFPRPCKILLIALEYLPSQKYLTQFQGHRLKKMSGWIDSFICLFFFTIKSYRDLLSLWIRLGFRKMWENINFFPLCQIFQIKEYVARFPHNWTINTMRDCNGSS